MLSSLFLFQLIPLFALCSFIDAGLFLSQFWKSFVHKVQELSLIFEIQSLVSSNFAVQWMISINHSTKKSLLQPYYSKNVFSDLKVLKLFQLILCLCNSTFTMWWRWRKNLQIAWIETSFQHLQLHS